MKQRKVIICGNYSRVVDYCRQNNLGPRDVIWAHGREVIMGIEIESEDDIIRLTPPPENLSEIEQELRFRIRPKPGAAPDRS